MSLPAGSRFLAEALAGAPEGLSVISVPAPRRPAAAALGVLRRIRPSSAMAWLPPHGARLVGTGSAATLSGAVTSPALRRNAETLLASTAMFTHDALPAISPRLLGGFAFNPRTAAAPPWERFGAGLLMLPRWTYGQEEGRAWLSIAVAGPLTAGQREDARRELDGLVTALDGMPAAVEDEPCRPQREVGSGAANAAANKGEGESRDAWRKRVEAVLREVEAGRVDKIVAARASEVVLDPSMDPPALLQALVRRFPRCTGFYMELDGRAFLGATPERLLSLTGAQVATEALAGSAPAGEAEALLESAKDRLEHRLVAEEIAMRLRPLCEDVRPGDIGLLDLPNIVHLRTPIQACARQSTTLLDLIASLHPTPAVAGVPRRTAVRWIEEHEPVSRGWYAGPFGWLDATGDGEFVVALRSGLLQEGRALLFAGAGLVAGSDPETEWEETEAKMRALGDVVGAISASGGVVPA